VISFTTGGCYFMRILEGSFLIPTSFLLLACSDTVFALPYIHTVGWNYNYSVQNLIHNGVREILSHGWEFFFWRKGKVKQRKEKKRFTRWFYRTRSGGLFGTLPGVCRLRMEGENLHTDGEQGRSDWGGLFHLFYVSALHSSSSLMGVLRYIALYTLAFSLA
jgi:hypothetical protein